MRKFGISEFSTKPTNYYNLEMIIAIGYRVKSIRGTQLINSIANSEKAFAYKMNLMKKHHH